jgi:hypothetical protein
MCIFVEFRVSSRQWSPSPALTREFCVLKIDSLVLIATREQFGSGQRLVRAISQHHSVDCQRLLVTKLRVQTVAEEISRDE